MKNKRFEVLAVGNSFSEDALAHLHNIAAALGKKDILIANLYIGGCSLATHYINAQNNNKDYEFQIWKDGNKQPLQKYSILDGLVYSDWDYISLQQVSTLSGQADTYDYDILRYLVSYFKQYTINPDVKIVWQATWAYQGNSNHEAFNNYDNNQMTMYNSINAAVKECINNNHNFELIIHNTTAIQNARTSYLGDGLTRDGFHLSLKEGRLIAALMYYKTLTNTNISQLPDRLKGYLDLDNYFYRMAVESVENAYNNPYQITKSKFIQNPERY